MKRSISTLVVSLICVVLARADETGPPPLADNSDELIQSVSPGVDGSHMRLALPGRDGLIQSVPLVPLGGRAVAVRENNAQIARTSLSDPAEPLPPPKQHEPLTPPRVLEEPALPYGGLDPAYFRQSRMEVWQNYAVDRTGHWRPRVIYSPSGAYYRYNGQPFPWAEVHGLEFMPYAGE
jgi:hypothetical protein